MKIKGIIAKSDNFSAVSCDPSLVKTRNQSLVTRDGFFFFTQQGGHTKTRGKESDIQVGDEFLSFRIKHALSGSNIARQADTDNLENGLEDQQDQIKERGMVGMRAGEELTGGDQARIGLGYEMTGDQRIGILEGTRRGKNGHQLWS